MGGVRRGCPPGRVRPAVASRLGRDDAVRFGRLGAAQELITTNPQYRQAPPSAPVVAPKVEAAPAPAPPAAVAPAPSSDAAAITQATRAISAPDPTDDADVIPKGAPSDDYEFVAWCAGILSGHMELFGRVKPELDDLRVVSRQTGRPVAEISALATSAAER